MAKLIYNEGSMMEDIGAEYRQPKIEISPEELQEARNNLLELRETFGYMYDVLPAPDRLIRKLDRAIELIPGEGMPSHEPYGPISTG